MRPFIILLLVGACTRHHHIAETHALGGDEVQVVGANGTSTAHGVETPNGVVFRDADTGRILLDAEIDRVEVTRRGAGALDGLAWGGLAGGLVGAIVGYADGDDHCDGELCIFEFSATDKAILGSLVFGGLGGVVGAITGAIIGATDVYEYPGAERRIVKPVGPPGSVAGVTFSF